MVFSSDQLEKRKPLKTRLLTDDELKEAAKRSEVFRKNHDWLNKHWKGLLQEHPNKWVLVVNEKPVLFADSLGELIRESLARGYEKDCPARGHLDPDPPIWVFAAVA